MLSSTIELSVESDGESWAGAFEGTDGEWKRGDSDRQFPAAWLERRGSGRTAQAVQCCTTVRSWVQSSEPTHKRNCAAMAIDAAWTAAAGSGWGSLSRLIADLGRPASLAESATFGSWERS